jgi:hypothetical protein
MKTYAADFGERAGGDHGTNRDCGNGCDEHGHIRWPIWSDSADCHMDFELDTSPMPTALGKPDKDAGFRVRCGKK